MQDVDGNNREFLGQATTTVGSIMGAKNQTVILDLMGEKNEKF